MARKPTQQGKSVALGNKRVRSREYQLPSNGCSDAVEIFLPGTCSDLRYFLRRRSRQRGARPRFVRRWLLGHLKYVSAA